MVKPSVLPHKPPPVAPLETLGFHPSHMDEALESTLTNFLPSKQKEFERMVGIRSFPIGGGGLPSERDTLPETNSKFAPENGWLED